MTGIERATGNVFNEDTLIDIYHVSSKPRKGVGKEPCCENCKFYTAKWGSYKCMNTGNLEGGAVPTDRWCKDFWPRPKEEKNE